MAVHMNRRMTLLYRPDGGAPAMPFDLEEILLRGFTFRDGLVFFQQFKTPDQAIADPDQYFDEIDYECRVNHFHFNGNSPADVVSIAIKFCRRADAIWASSGFPGQLRFIVSVNDTEGTIRFHRVREGMQWLLDDLNRYEHEAIFVYDTGRNHD